MSQATQSSWRTQPEVITKVPPEIIMEVFKFVVLSSEDARSHGAKTLCLVNKRWNDIANATPVLWTKVTLAFPLHPDQLAASKKWIKTSEPKVIDIKLDLCDPTWHYHRLEGEHPLAVHGSSSGAVAVLEGSENRWRSLSIQSEVESLIQEFLEARGIPSLPVLESVCIKRVDAAHFPHRRNFGQPIEWPSLPGGKGTLMPKLREISINAVCIEWASAAAISFKNLRKLEIGNEFLFSRDSPSIEQFSAFLVASPGLEILDVSGYEPNWVPDNTVLPPVHLPKLKRFCFGWKLTNPARTFLKMLQIPETLEALSLNRIMTIACRREYDPQVYINEFGDFPVFGLLADLGPGDSEDNDPPRPWISTLGLKTLSVSWVDSDEADVIAVLCNAPVVEEIRLTDVSQAVFEGIETLVQAQCLPSLKRIYVWWILRDGPGETESSPIVEYLRGVGLEVVVKRFDWGGKRLSLHERVALAKEDPDWA